MKSIFIIVLILVVLIVSVTAFLLLTQTSYSRFQLSPIDTNQSCAQYYQECRCMGGSVSVLESYPPMYACHGLEFCTEVNYTDVSNCQNIVV